MIILTPLTDRPNQFLDHPDAFEHDLKISKHLALLKEKQSIFLSMTFSTHSRTTEVERIEPAELIIVEEGHLLFVIPEVVREFELRIFISAPEELCLKQVRLERDVSERGRTPESIRSQFASRLAQCMTNI